MSRLALEKRVAALERQMGVLLANHREIANSKNWQSTLGAFTGDQLMKRIFAEGRKIRNAEKVRRLDSQN